jgi:hypothetical protein
MHPGLLACGRGRILGSFAAASLIAEVDAVSEATGTRSAPFAERADVTCWPPARRCVSARSNGILRKVKLTQLEQGGLSA